MGNPETGHSEEATVHQRAWLVRFGIFTEQLVSSVSVATMSLLFWGMVSTEVLARSSTSVCLPNFCTFACFAIFVHADTPGAAPSVVADDELQLLYPLS